MALENVLVAQRFSSLDACFGRFYDLKYLRQQHISTILFLKKNYYIKKAVTSNIDFSKGWPDVPFSRSIF